MASPLPPDCFALTFVAQHLMQACRGVPARWAIKRLMTRLPGRPHLRRRGRTRRSFRLSSSSLFQITPNGGRYLIETDPRFADYRQWLGSDYLLGLLGVDPTRVHKRLGDAITSRS